MLRHQHIGKTWTSGPDLVAKHTRLTRTRSAFVLANTTKSSFNTFGCNGTGMHMSM
jgi:hypothetical protein